MSSLSFWVTLALLSTVEALSLTAADLCSSLTAITLENTTIVNSFRQPAGANISTPLSCYEVITSAVVSTDVCRVQGFVNTTAESSIQFEAWLPDVWYGRFMGLGNGGLGGCYDWPNLDYTTGLHFAAISTNNGHDGGDGLPFLNHPEVINDFAYRSIHTEAVIGKQIVEAYYSRKPANSYYMGCSAGGRQAVQTATMFPEDFDGFIGGAPGVNWNNLIGSFGMLARYVDAPSAQVSNGFISAELWPVVSKEILDQCDDLDGLVDGTISEPDHCEFDPEPLLCKQISTDNCLNEAQVEALRKIYSPILGSDGNVLFPRYDPGGEGDGGFQYLFSGQVVGFTTEWFKYAVYNDSGYTFENFSISDVEFANALNPGNIATWDGDLSAFRDRGGKFLTYHGRSDPLLASGISNQLYEKISDRLSTPNLDEFYRLFRIPGMGHCVLGSGAYLFGQGTGLGSGTNAVNDTSHNILLALVDWVEGGIAPDTITGLDVNGMERTHCRYPLESVWDGEEWVCV